MDQNFNLDQIKEVAAAVWKEGKDTPIWAFYAPMGTGKTTLIHAICEALGVKDTISSPTFALVHEYQHTGGSIFHMDWYRIGSMEEAIRAGIDEHLHSGHACFIEWPENVPALLTAPVFEIRLSLVDEKTRHIYSTVKC
jgi:tRNA threonylcarbamoyladenosine biosynthesis protein TsaE